MRKQVNRHHLAYLLLFISLSQQQQHRDIVFDDIRPKQLVPVYVVKHVENTELLKCLQICVLESRCKSVNYSPTQKKCNLLAISLIKDETCIHQDNEWMYYGSIKESQERGVDLMCRFKEERANSDEAIFTVPKFEKSWYLSVDVKPHGATSYYGHFMHGINPNRDILKLYFPPNVTVLSYKIFLDQAYDKNREVGQLPLHEYTNVKVMETTINNVHTCKVFLNDTLYWEAVENNPVTESNVEIYAGRKGGASADVDLKNILFHNIE